MPKITALAIDTGGTFTDCVAFDEDGNLYSSKAHSTPPDLADGVLNSVANLAASLGLSAREVLEGAGLLLHGTTATVNTWLTRSGPTLGLITTKGHEDALLIGRVYQKVTGIGEWETTYAVKLKKADPIIPRPLIKGVAERIDYRGRVVVPLNLEEVRQAARELIAAGVQAIVVSLLWSFKNPSHEQQIKDVLQREFHEVRVSLSSELVPVLGEYERTATAAINAYLIPSTSRYFGTLKSKLQENGFRSDVLIMNNQGGCIPLQEATEKPIFTWSSGPVGGLLGARALAELLGYKQIVTTDVGGTSFDVGVAHEGDLVMAKSPSIGKYHIAIPMVDIASIGAGGGSIARVEPLTKSLEVGPRSAGARPGPACYALGGVKATVTDADVVLGRINPGLSLGGQIALDKERAISAIRDQVAKPLGMDVFEAAKAIVDIVDANMADLVRKVSIEKGFDPQDFVLFAFGGSGPTHAASYARDIGVNTVVIPALASVFSAFGIAMSDIVRWYVKSSPMMAPFSAEDLELIFGDLEVNAKTETSGNGLRVGSTEVIHFVEMKYRHQVNQLRLPVQHHKMNVGSLLDDFDAAYEDNFGPNTAYRQAGVELVTCGLIVTQRIRKPLLRVLDPKVGRRSREPKETREVFFGDRLLSTPIYDLGGLSSGVNVDGPAIIEGPGMAVVVPPNDRSFLDDYGNIVLQLAK